jgi:hypothetical protein
MTGTTAADQIWLNSLYSRIYQSHDAGNYYADAVTLQSLLAVTGNMWDPMAVLASPMPGDFNDDGSVDAADYVVWRKVDRTQAGYNMWRAHFGEAGDAAIGASHATVPEPSPWLLLLVFAAARVFRRRL